MGSGIGVRASSLARRFRAAAGATGQAQVLRASVKGRLGGDGQTPVPFRAKRLGGESIWVRPRSTDLVNAVDYLNLELYLPPPELRGEQLENLVELGSNIGACLTCLGVHYPHARIVGVEPDPSNHQVAVQNTARFGERVSVVNAAIWEREVDLVVEDEGAGEHGLTVRERTAEDPPSVSTTPGLPIATLIANHLADGAEVDYMHVSMEGAEPIAFEAPGWAERVRSLRVEAHPYFDYDAKTCIRQLEALGYRAWPDPELPAKWVYAVRD